MYFERGATSLREFMHIQSTNRGPIGWSRLDEGSLCYFSHGLARTLDALHEIGVFYIDLKLSNVVLDMQGRVMLIDMGLLALKGLYAHTYTNAQFYIAPEIHGKTTYRDGSSEVPHKPVGPLIRISRVSKRFREFRLASPTYTHSVC